MEVRRMRAGEGKRLRELRLTALADAPAAFGSSFERDAARPLRLWEDLARGPGVVFVAGDWSGMAGIFVADARPVVWGMWVEPPQRGSGAGRALLEAAVEWAEIRGFEALHLHVMEHAPQARAFYEALGFAPTGAAADRGQIALARPLRREPRRMQTERLVIREFVEADLPAMRALRSREESVRWLDEDPSTEDQDRARLRRRIEQLRFALTGDALGFAVEADGALVADISLFLTSAEDHQAEIGFITHPDHQGRGYASEAAAAVLRLAFHGFGLHRVVGRLEARNVASARVCEKLGMRREAHLVENELVKGEWQSELIYAIRGPTASRDA